MPSSKHDSLDINPIDLKEYSCKQSKHSHVPKVPLRMILSAPSGSGKTVLLSNLILNIIEGASNAFSCSVLLSILTKPGSLLRSISLMI